MLLISNISKSFLLTFEINGKYIKMFSVKYSSSDLYDNYYLIASFEQNFD